MVLGKVPLKPALPCTHTIKPAVGGCTAHLQLEGTHRGEVPKVPWQPACQAIASEGEPDLYHNRLRLEQRRTPSSGTHHHQMPCTQTTLHAIPNEIQAPQ